MKSSRKILLITGCVVLIGLVASLIVTRNVALQFLHKTAAESKYKPIPVTDFERLDFSSNWDVRIWQGNEFKVELAIDENSPWKPNLENIDGTLYFKQQAVGSVENSQPIYAKIIAPSLKGIKAIRGTKISLDFFDHRPAKHTRSGFGFSIHFQGTEKIFQVRVAQLFNQSVYSVDV